MIVEIRKNSLQDVEKSHLSRDAIVGFMKNCLVGFVFFSVLILLPSGLLAQAFSFGILIGGGSSLEDGFEVDLGNKVFEVFGGMKLEDATAFRLKYGQVDVDGETAAGEIEYFQAVVDYEFDEVFGSTSLFAGPGYYSLSSEGVTGGVDQSELGFAVGVAGDFPISRRLSLIAELSYQWINFEDSYSFWAATGGFKIRF